MAKSKKTKQAPKRKRITLEFTNQPGRDIFAVGDFNDWSVEDKKKAKPMKDKAGDGTYKVTMMLQPGEYEYKFYSDGEWFVDPAAETNKQNRFGTFNSVLTI